MCETFETTHETITLKTLDLNGNSEITNSILSLLFDTIGKYLHSLRCLDISKTNLNANIISNQICKFFKKYHNITNIDSIAFEDLLNVNDNCGATNESIDKIQNLSNIGALPKAKMCDFYIFTQKNTNLVLEMSVSD